MSNKNLRSFRDQARNVKYAYENTRRQYNDHPPRPDLVPIAGAINAWTHICSCYMGIEQTMKLLIRIQRDGTANHRDELGRKLGHDLVKAYSLLDSSERDVVANYLRVYRSLHNFDTGNVSVRTADDFIHYIGNGYEAWRYILTEDHKEMPKMHLGLMLETWRAMVDLVQHHVSGRTCHALEGDLERYIIDEVYRSAERDQQWQAASQDENSAVEFRGVHDWFFKGRRPLEAGIELFTHLAQGTGDSIEAVPLLRQVLLRAAATAMQAVWEPTPLNRQEDIAMFHHRINNGGLAWNAIDRLFESCPAS